MACRERSAAGGMRDARPASRSAIESEPLPSGMCAVPRKTPFLSSDSTSISMSRCSSAPRESANASSAKGSATEPGWSRRAVAGQRTPASAKPITQPSRGTRHLKRAPCTTCSTVARTRVSRCSAGRKACARALLAGSVRSWLGPHGRPVGALPECAPNFFSLAARSASCSASMCAVISSPRAFVFTCARPAPISPAARFFSPTKTAA
mmetsp:Transcript_16900/g.52516  ORF Transcript_16900/g.52516 Transcript_16900/m.52516 type:complete len:208 (+) Transcript_16900:1452-2075(+)